MQIYLYIHVGAGERVRGSSSTELSIEFRADSCHLPYASCAYERIT